MPLLNFLKVLAQDLNRSTDIIVESSPNMSGDFFLETVFFNFLEGVNFFLIAWSFFYTFVSMVQFFEFRIFNGGGELAVEKQGMLGLQIARGIWFRYLATLPFYGLYLYFRFTPASLILAVIAFIPFLLKLYFDLLEILDLVDYFGWAKGFAGSFKKSLNFKKD